ncbi:MAG TPA: hypothetical protein VL371_04620 [Gemmataceae bacterium]|nr:hypothetical protein [Gemmataceae bacterium]
MGFLPFVNQGGQRVVRWPRLMLAWASIMLATLLGSCAMGYVLAGDWWCFNWNGIWMGVFFSASLAVYGFTTPVDRLPRIPAGSNPGVGNP